jgi:Acetyltransferase (GNAT) domain
LGSIADIEAGAWNRVFAGRCEAFEYYRACELAALDAFQHAAIGIFEGDRLVGGAPLFSAVFRLDMTFPLGLRKLGNWIYAWAPRLISLRVVGAGSPHADELALGMDPVLCAEQRATAFEAMLVGIDRHAAQNRTGVLFIKDVSDTQALSVHDILAKNGYARLPTLPVAVLALPYRTEAEYIASLSANMRSNLRRKLKLAAKVQVQICTDITGVEAELLALRRHTQENAKANYGDFEELSPGYFRAVMARLGNDARLLLYRVDGELVGFSLVLLSAHELIYKYSGMRYPAATDHGVYFLNWMVMVRLCLERGIPRLHAGETTYVTKTRLGCRMERSWIYFRHRSRFLNAFFKVFGPLIAIDKTDPDLRELGARAPFVEPTSPR